jgi:hypothetical protein
MRRAATAVLAIGIAGVAAQPVAAGPTVKKVQM